jgi:hypothetical protein
MDADSHSPFPSFPLKVFEIRIDNIQIEKQLRGIELLNWLPDSDVGFVGVDGDHDER